MKGGVEDKGSDVAEAMVLVPAALPVGEVLNVEMLTGFAEALEDGVIGKAFVEHLVEGLADVIGQASDFAVARVSGRASEGFKGRPEVEELSGSHGIVEEWQTD